MSRRSGSMSGRWKRNMAALVSHRQPKGWVKQLGPARHIWTLRRSSHLPVIRSVLTDLNYDGQSASAKEFQVVL
jgi:hypothetical protein